MYITIEIMPTEEREITKDDLDTTQCPDCQSSNFYLTEEGDGYCFDCGTYFTPNDDMESGKQEV